MERNLKEYYNDFVSKLTKIYFSSEAESISKIVFQEIFGEKIFLTFPLQFISSRQSRQLEKILLRLLKHEPLQYIFGHTFFYGLKLEVNKNVLIPRPETEELVEWIVNENKTGKGIQIIDIGTGSGCIALALKSKFNDAAITAMDVSIKAVQVAKKNSDKLKLKINFAVVNILNGSEWNYFKNKKFDVIVSNPPYIPLSEKNKMRKNVTGFEPSIALFVEDKNPFVFYESIADFSIKYLKPNGKLYFEINESYGNEVVKIIRKKGFKVLLKKDLSGKNRMIRCERK